MAPAKPTEVYNIYWRFASERHSIFLSRLQGNVAPWTDDPILQAYKFTNSYRANDRVSQFLLSDVIGSDDLEWEDTFFRILLFKIFNKISTWELLEEALGEIDAGSFSLDVYDKILSTALSSGTTIFSAAYIMPSGGKEAGGARKHLVFLRLLQRMLSDDLPQRILESGAMHKAFDMLVSYPMIGNFLAYQFITDLNYSRHLGFTETEFVVPGPGARDGIAKCFCDLGGFGEADIIRLIQDRQLEECERAGVPCPSLWGRAMQLIDCQNVFCEVDKYSRVAFPNVLGRTTRTRIKQRYRASDPLPIPTYPAKWGIAPALSEWLEKHRQGVQTSGTE